MYHIDTNTPLVIGLSLLSDILHFFLSIGIFELFFFEYQFFSKIRIQTHRQIFKMILKGGMQ